MEPQAHASLETPTGADALSERDRDILEFERQWWKYAGAKETAVREKFDMSSTRYYQVLNALIDRPEALEADPLFREVLGPQVVDEFLKLKRMEWVEYSRHVSDWEIERYTEFF